MIALERERTIQAINAKYRGADKRERDKQLMLARRAFLNNNDKPIEFKSAFWKTAKRQLKKESNGKCAYCEANTEVVAHGDVEHYRPKSIYWWLVYTYDNYLYACQICNQVYKSDNFPISGNAYPSPQIDINTTDITIDLLTGNVSPDPIDITINYTLQQYMVAHQDEQALLLNPYFDNPATYFAYEVDDIKEEVKIIATKLKYTNRIKAAEDYYGINRLELRNVRYTAFRNFRIVKKMYTKLTVDGTDEVFRKEVKKQIDNMLSNKYLFAGMNRYFDNRL